MHDARWQYSDAAVQQGVDREWQFETIQAARRPHAHMHYDMYLITADTVTGLFAFYPSC